jgi:MtrB/PioB family decaheme-associated outer membrane protein
MSTSLHPSTQRRALPAAVFAACAALIAGQAVQAQDKEDTRPLDTRWQLDYNGSVELGVGYISDQNFEFGEYNGLSDDGAVFIGNLDWSGGADGATWNLQGSDLGLDTRSGRAEWRNDTWKVFFELESFQQVHNDSGRSPYRGGEVLSLPSDWVSAVNTSGFTALDGSLRGVDQELNRDRYTLGVAARLNDAWSVEGSFKYEEKDGTQDMGAAIFQNASAGNAVILPQDLDYETSEFDFAVNYAADNLVLSGSVFYSDFDNGDDLLVWQNPYNIFGPNVRYPNGFGGMSQAPDNEYYRLRLLGTYIFSPTLRFQVDGSYGHTEQDQNFADYTVNPNLSVTVPLPRQSLDGETDTNVLDARVFWRPMQKLNLEGWYHGEERDYDLPRDGYQYVLGDATSQLPPAQQVYNTAHDYTSNRGGIEASYPLPWRSKLWVQYEYEEVKRTNAAVEKTEEDRYQLRYRIPILDNLSSRLELNYGDLSADTYEWDASYYALLDAERINETPDSQRYITHPLLSQYWLANRERTEVKWDVDWQPALTWNLSANLLWREDDYDKTDLGLRNQEISQVNLTASWTPSTTLSLAAYGSYGEYERQQRGRSFRGGIEKNAFEIFPPLPQASDPARNWDVDNDDEVGTIGFNAQWQLRRDISLEADYSYVKTESDYDFSSGGASDIGTESLGDEDTEQHHLLLEGAWHMRENLSIKVNYQYWSYEGNDWAINGVTPNSIDKVLTLGEKEPDEDVHYIGTSIIYRWQ